MKCVKGFGFIIGWIVAGLFAVAFGIGGLMGVVWSLGFFGYNVIGNVIDVHTAGSFDTLGDYYTYAGTTYLVNGILICFGFLVTLGLLELLRRTIIGECRK